MARQDVAILRGGLVTSVGLDAPSACAAIRGAISGFEEISYPDRAGAYISGACVPIDARRRGINRLAHMVAMAVKESLMGVEVQNDSLPLLLCVAEEDRPGRINRLEDKLIVELNATLGGILHKTKSTTVSHGRVGGVIALGHARRLVHEEGFPLVVIAGVDSLLARPTLREFERRDRLKTSHNSDGFIPGEAAAAVVVAAPPGRGDRLVCVGLGYGTENAAIESGTPLRADGLTEAIKAAFSDAGCDSSEVDFRITDNSGEQYYFKEAALALARTLRVRKEEFDIWHPADCIGEVGAAIGPAILTVALVASQKGYAAGDGILCQLGGDNGQRAAAVLRYQRSA